MVPPKPKHLVLVGRTFLEFCYQFRAGPSGRSVKSVSVA
jgi:hypothetical protein